MRILFGILVFAMSLFAGEGGQTGFAFLRIAPDARSAAMGETGAASGGAPFLWNPAFLISRPGDAFQFTYNRWIEDVAHHTIFFRSASETHSWGLHAIYTGVDGIQKREIASEDPTALIASHDLAIGFSYAVRAASVWSVGITTRYVYERIESSVHAIGFDAGVARDIAFGSDSDKLKVGASFSNIGFSGRFVDESVRLPASFRIGGMYRATAGGADTEVRLSADVVHWLHEGTFLHTGAEAGYRNSFFLRAGYQFGYVAKGFSAGLGVKLNDRFAMDYAFVPIGNALGTSHRLTFGVNF